MTDKELDRLRFLLAGVTCPEIMHGTGLAIVLCTVYENPDEEPDDETRWTQSALDGCERALDAIHEHYAPTIKALHVRADAAEVERDENEAVIRVWRRRCEEAEAERDRLRAEAEELEAQLNAEVMDQFDEVRMRVEAEAERDRLTEALEKIESICDAALGGPDEDIPREDFYVTRARWYLDSTREALEVARAAFSGSEARTHEITPATALEAAARIAERRHLSWSASGDHCEVDDDVSACEDIARAIRLFAIEVFRHKNQARACAALSGGDDG